MPQWLNFVLDPPTSRVLAVGCLVVVPWLWIRGNRTIRKSMGSPGHPDQSRWMIRGIRDGIVALALISLGVGLWLRSTGFLLFGLIFVGEELVETGVMLLAARRKSPSPGETP